MNSDDLFAVSSYANTAIGDTPKMTQEIGEIVAVRSVDRFSVQRNELAKAVVFLEELVDTLKLADYYFSVVGGSIKVYMGWFTADLAIWPMKTVPVSVLSTTDIVGFSIATLAEPSWTITQLTNNLRRLRFWSQPDSSHWGLIVIEELQ